MPENVMSFVTQIQTLFTQFGLKILGAVALVLIGKRVASFVKNLVLKATSKSSLDPTLSKFAVSFIYYAIMAFVIMAALGMVGIETTSFVAILGAVSLAMGLAFEGALSNFAAGMLLIIFRPFKEGDWIEAADTSGIVEDIQLVTTKIITFENEAVIIPNSEITGGAIKNFSEKHYVEHEMEFFVDYETDIDRAVEIVQAVLDSSEFTVAEPASGAYVVEQTETAVKLLAEANIHPQDREDVQYDVVSRVMRDFKAAGISAPQQRMRMINVTS